MNRLISTLALALLLAPGSALASGPFGQGEVVDPAPADDGPLGGPRDDGPPGGAPREDVGVFGEVPLIGRLSNPPRFMIDRIYPAGTWDISDADGLLWFHGTPPPARLLKEGRLVWTREGLRYPTPDPEKVRDRVFEWVARAAEDRPHGAHPVSEEDLAEVPEWTPDPGR